ncbi:MAG TPA: hypothetical protein VF849_00070 [Blattabacteriaceae bacterium]
MTLFTFIRLYAVRKSGPFLPREVNMEGNFIKYMLKEGHIESNGMGYYSVTERCAKNLEAVKQTMIKLDGNRGWKEIK